MTIYEPFLIKAVFLPFKNYNRRKSIEEKEYILQLIRQLLTSLMIYISIKRYCKKKKIQCKMDNLLKTIRISQGFLSLYFIIIAKKSNYKTMVKAIRSNESTAQIILLASEIDYQYIFKNHLELLGIIDLSENSSYVTLLELIKGYIDDFFEIQSENHH